MSWARALALKDHTAGPSGRTIIVGDVHGCRDELRALLHEVDFQQGRDRLVLVGDLVGKGPHPKDVVRIARSFGAVAVRGNHEHGLLNWRARGAPEPDPLREMTPSHRSTVEQLEAEDWAWLTSLPYHIDLGGVIVVHAGLVPGVALEQQRHRDMVEMRTIDPVRKVPSKNFSGGDPWARSWPGPALVVFGHDARRGLQQEPFAIGLDTGAVYGKRLTALVLPSKTLVSVPAQAQYVVPDV